jgi:CBS domain containing-hemolysin-like protein
MIHNALSLDDILISDIMTPRTVVTALEQNLTIEDVFSDYKNIPFARIPVYDETIDNIVGIVRRRDLLQARADDRDSVTVAELKGESIFVPDTANAADALQLFLKNHQQLGVVVDEFGSTAGVVAMEDIVEHILGREIYEESDIAVDMRVLARRKARSNNLNPQENKISSTDSPPSAAARRSGS